MGKDLNGVELGKGFTQRGDGSYQYRYPDKYGKRRSIYSPSIDKLREEVAALNTEPKVASTVMTLDDWYAQWMEVYKYEVRPSTRLHYANVYEKHISPILGKCSLADITTLDVRRLLNTLDASGFGFETRNKARIILLDMFDRAVMDDFAFKNPARGIKLKRNERYERRVLSKEEQFDFFETCRGTFYDELFTVAVLTGLRPGELYALRWQDIDLTTNTLRVTRTLLYQKLEGDSCKTFHIHPPKTDASNRIVSFSDRCATALKRQFCKKSNISLSVNAKTIPGLEDLLFVTKYNTPLNASIYCDAIRRIVDLINESRSPMDQFEPFTGHCFRHTYATRCFEAGVDAKVVQKQLGHASLKMTMDLYTHLFEDKREEELDKFASYSEDVFNAADYINESRYRKALHPKVVHL